MNAVRTGQVAGREAGITDTFTITPLDVLDEAALASAVSILEAAFNDPERYGKARILSQLQPADLPFYRRFFVARRAGEVVGIGGVKAADWASDTHILYLSAVAEHARGQGIARALINARIAWVMETFGNGRLLVSTARSRRFARLGFRLMGKREAGGRRLMLLEF